jgi:hypothetical protein
VEEMDCYTKPQTFEDIKRESKKREKMSESVLSEGEELKNYRIEVERLITRESEKYSNCEQARQHYVTVCNQLKNMQVVVDRTVMESLTGRNDVRSQLLGKRIHDEMWKVIRKYPVLNFAVLGEVDLGLDQEECEEEIIDGPPIIGQREVDRFQDMCDIEKANAVEFLEKFRSSGENTLEGINGIERGLFTVEEVNNYTTNILRGGLTPVGRLTEDVIKRFNELAQEREVQMGLHSRMGLKKAAELNRQLEDLQMYYYPEIWQQEDEIGMYAYIKSQLVPYMGQTYIRETRKRESDIEALEKEKVEIERSFAKRVQHVQSLIENKWKERKVLASKIISKNEKKEKNEGKLSDNGESRNVKNVIIAGYLDMITEICLKISSVADIQIRSELNKPLRGKARSGEFYSSLDRKNLAGVMMILDEKYKHAPITMMFESLEELFSGQIDSSEVGKVMEWVNSKIILWAEFQFFDYMVPDVLFSFVALFRMPSGETRQRCCREVLARMRVQENLCQKNCERKGQWGRGCH